MNILLDTHAFLWFAAGSASTSKKARALIENAENAAFLSVASLWEIAIKVSLGKLELMEPFEKLIPEQLEDNNIGLLHINVSHAALVANLPFHHRDPFDRLLIAQAKVEQIPIISTDKIFDEYDVERIW
ncbi:MAG: type II toxin-antitoxin system VapC family toxin [Anaerolineae bacterium CFX3]|jgi:PIN domain nuclease of toxin-antitoxin system|nr:hypothetical protein [Anaerolineales bacterium]MCC7512843.1 type II toxin-antitoxin system VapC family toxin [Anaerolineae bacterium]MCE7905115.1 type II toxin-antitoxin system VapC family toxin [Anaerolineae bacterium CFX3]OQY86663.1 MAG: twitching motility protein PilT [Anaerolineae bacterium UTCFX3]MBW7919023.1 type II toxin-antitoxin system VapC family toxin [Anaerolineales bacterium]